MYLKNNNKLVLIQLKNLENISGNCILLILLLQNKTLYNYCIKILYSQYNTLQILKILYIFFNEGKSILKLNFLYLNVIAIMQVI